MSRVLLLLLATALSSPVLAQDAADLILYNGKIVTVDSAFSVARAVAVRNGRILAVGGDDIRRRYRADRVIDLRGRMVLPGFHDPHTHHWPLGRRGVDLTGVGSMAELQARIRTKAAELGPGEWIVTGGGYGWLMYDLAERRAPNRHDLDEAAPNNPVYLAQMGGHSYAANTRALELAGVTRDTPDPAVYGIVERDSAGEPTGIFREGPAIGLVYRAIPSTSSAEKYQEAIPFLHGLLEKGITSIVEANWSVSGYKHWERIYAEHGDSLPRVSVQPQFFSQGKEGIAGGTEELKRFGRKTGDGNERVRLGAIKLIVDGGFSGAAAATLEPYANDSTWYGVMRIPPDSLYRIVKAAHELGWQVGLHTIGDSAIKTSVDVLARVLRESPRPGHRHYLNHFTVLPPEETLRKMRENDILIVQQPNFLYTNEGLYRQYLRGERLEHVAPLRTPMDHGIFLALSSDNIPLGPMLGIYAAVTRKGKSGQVYGAGEALSIREAIRAYTKHSAYVTGEEDIKGSVEPGMLADLVVLSEDLLTIDPDRIPDVQVEMTILGGEIVYERNKVAPSRLPRTYE